MAKLLYLAFIIKWMIISPMRYLTLLVLFVFSAGLLSAQATLKGFVKSSESGEPVLFANVIIKGTSKGVTTDLNGYYTLSKVPLGKVTVVVSSLEYVVLEQVFDVEEEKIYTLNFQLETSTIQLESAVISSDREERETQINTGIETIRPQDVKRVPSFGGTPDLVQVMVTLPGFVSTGDQGGQLYIRGGSPVQNKVLLDGMIIYNAFHSIGLFSIFDTDIIKNADVYTGGFGAQYGGRVSSVMDVSTKDGNKSGISGKVDVSTFGAKLMLEGPLKKLRQDGSGISYIVSAKKSYLEQSSKLLYSYIDEEGLPFNYTDLYGKISFASGSGSKFNVFGFSFTDQVKYKAVSDLNWKNNGVGANFVVVPPGSPMLIKGNFSISDYNVTLKEENVPDRFSEISSFNFGLDFKYSDAVKEIKYGVEVAGYRTNYETFNSLGVTVKQEENVTEFGAYLSYRLSKRRWIIEPGFRFQYYASTGASPEPRLGVKYKATERLRIKAAAGLYSQNVISANSDRDVVNLFYGFLVAPKNLQKEFVKPNGTIREVNNPLQKSSHVVTGVEFDLTERIHLNVEGYLKHFSQLTNTNRNKLFPDDADHQDKPEVLRKDYIVESGVAQGVDFVFNYEHRNSYIWIVYSLSNVDRWDGTRWYDPVFDRLHNINFVASQGFGKDASWEVSTRWNFGSGFPFTQTQGFYQPFNVTDGISSDYVAINTSELGIVYAQLNEGRLPYYHRLDLSLRKTMKFDNKRQLDLSFGITNVYSRQNIFYIDRVTGERVDQLPFMPSVGLEYRF